MSVAYDIDSTRVTLREYAWETPWLLLPLIVVLRLLRIRLPGSSDEPLVESLRPCEVTADVLPADVSEQFLPWFEKLDRLGFHSPVFHAIVDHVHATQIVRATFVHSSGETVARVHHRIWRGATPPRSYCFPEFISSFRDGTFLVTSGGGPDLQAPETVRTVHQKGSAVEHLWESHQRQQREDALRRGQQLVRTGDELRDTVEQLHVTVRDFHVQRGVFRPRPAPPTTESDVVVADVAEAPFDSSPDEPVLAELERLRHQKTSWVSMIVLLGLSLGVFAGFGLKDHGWSGLLLIIGVLFIHEMGHYVAMKWFGYRNVKMFFIPFLGAAVSGRHYNVAGWKKAIVSLMGPVPGIALGTALGVAGLVLEQSPLVTAGLVFILLNAFNLIPVLPLDGGWVLHATLFCRHPVLDVGFRLIAGLLLLMLAVVGPTRLTLFLGIPLLISLGHTLRVGRAAEKLRRQGISQWSEDAQSIPLDTARQIIAEVRHTFSAALTPKLIAESTLQIFETLNARPPHWLVTLLLLGVHGFSLVLAIIVSIVLIIGQQGSFEDLIAAAQNPLPQTFECGETDTWRGLEAARQELTAAGDEGREVPPAARTTLVATFPSSERAVTTYDNVVRRLPPFASATRFGNTLLVSFPSGEAAAITEWEQQLRPQAASVYVSTPDSPVVFSLSGIAPSAEDAERIELAVREYLQADARMFLVPPWLPADTRPAGARSAHDRARRTMRLLIEANREVTQDPRLREFMKKELEAWKNDQLDDEFPKIAAERDALVRQVRRERYEQIRRDNQDIDGQLIDLYLQRLEKREAAAKARLKEGAAEGDPAAANANLAAGDEPPSDPETLALGQRMGQLPLEGSSATPLERQYSTRAGEVTRHGLFVRLDYLNFEHLEAGVAALAAWLCAVDCVDIHFEFFDPAEWE